MVYTSKELSAKGRLSASPTTKSIGMPAKSGERVGGEWGGFWSASE